LARQLSHYLYLYFFSFGLTIYKKYGKVSHSHSYMKWDITVLYHMIKSHKECGKIVHRPCSSCISSVQEINENSIKFSLSTQTWRVIKLSRLSYYTGLRNRARTIV